MFSFNLPICWNNGKIQPFRHSGQAAPCRRITQAPAQAPGQEALVMQLLEETLNKN